MKLTLLIAVAACVMAADDKTAPAKPPVLQQAQKDQILRANEQLKTAQAAFGQFCDANPQCKILRAALQSASEQMASVVAGTKQPGWRLDEQLNYVPDVAPSIPTPEAKK